MKYSMPSKPVLLLLLFLGFSLQIAPHADAGSSLGRCPQLQDLSGINYNLFTGSVYYYNGEYFCSDEAPEQFRCKCGVASVCKTKADPWGANIGTCDCCPAWMLACFFLLAFLFFISACVAIYAIACQGKWWCDGYMMPAKSLIPRRAPAVICPASSARLPENVFRSFPSTDFVNVVENPETEPLLQQQQQQQQQEHQQQAFVPNPSFRTSIRRNGARRDSLQHTVGQGATSPRLHDSREDIV